jgi:hypothetical protein
MSKDLEIAIEPRYFHHKGGLDSETAERYAKLIYLCLGRGDAHASLLWLKKAIDEHYNEIDVYAPDFKKITIASSDLPQRLINTLDRNGYVYWYDLVDVDHKHLKSIRNIGEIEYIKIVTELHKVIKKHTK